MDFEPRVCEILAQLIMGLSGPYLKYKSFTRPMIRFGLLPVIDCVNPLRPKSEKRSDPRYD